MSSANFGLLANLTLDGPVDAQPLYVPGIVVGGTTHNVLYVVTENDTLYAFDADTGGTPLWTPFSALESGETASDSDSGCGQVGSKVGITSTPAIDLTQGPNGIIYFVAMTKDAMGNYHDRLHAVDLVAGTEQSGWPIEISATYNSTGPNSSAGKVTFDPKEYKERAALLISNGVIYTSWASNCDHPPYNGWIIGYNESSQTQTVLNLTPNGGDGAIWMSGAGPAADAGGNLYFLMANGTFDTTLNSNGFPSDGDYGNAFMNLSTTSGLAVADYFTMDNTVSESNGDEDLGSGGAMLLPTLNDALGNPHELAVGAGKDGNAYVVDRNNMGKFNMSSNAVYQEFALGGGVYSSPAWFNNSLYYGAVGQQIQAFPYSGGSFGPASFRTSVSGGFGFPAATPSISANGSASGIVWAVKTGSPAVLYAFDASNLNELYDSTQAANSRDSFGAGITFPTPTVFDGKVYVGTTTGVAIFGLLHCSYTLTFSVTSSTTGNIAVSTGAGCSWSVSNDSDFITITSGFSGTGPGTVDFELTAYEGASRTGIVFIAGQALAIRQGGTNSLAAPSNPSPANGSEGALVNPTLSWTAASGATSYDVYFGTTPNPPLVTNTASASYAPGILSPGITYYWMVVAKNSGGTSNSPVWSFITGRAIPTAVSVTPSSGSVASQTFALQYSDTAGTASLQTVWAYFNSTLASAATNTCLLYYNQTANVVNLLNDNGSTWQTATPGTATTLQNSQCSLNVAGTSVALNGNTLTLNLAMTFKPAYAGAKNIYLYAADLSGANSGWQQLGTWTVPGGASGPAAVSVTPSSGSVASQTFALQYSDTAGAASLQTVWAYFNGTLASPATNTCLLYYNLTANVVNLLNDNGSTWQTATPGTATTLQNSQCSLNVAGTSVALNGNTLTLNLAMTFKPAYAGAKNIYLYAADPSGSNSGWQPLGTWTVPGGASGPTAVSVTPSSGSVASQTFALQYSDTAGAANLQTVWAYFNGTLASPATNTCLLYYNLTANVVNLLNDNGSTWQTATPGTAATLQNSQCSLNVAGTSVALNGNTLTLNLAMTFKPAYAGAKNIYLYAADLSGSNSGWQSLGTWTVLTGSSGPATVSVAPSSGSVASQTFALQYSDTAGAASLQTVWAYFNGTLANPATSTCLLYYNLTANVVNLLNDNGSTWQTAIPGTATTLQNSQCSLNVAETSVALNGNTLTLNLAMTFKPAYAGAENIYLYAADVSGSNSGWQQLGTWTVP